MAVTTLLLLLAALCQLLLVFICIGGFAELAHRWATREKGDAAPRPRTAIGLPATIAVVLNAAFLNMALLIISFASFATGELPNGLYILLSLGFGGFAVCAIAAMSATQSRAKPLIGQLAVSVVGLVCVFAAYNLAGGS
jgi:hypothetical protein